MNEKALDVTDTDNWRPKVLIIGAVVGAAVGLGAAYLLAQNQKPGEGPPKISGGEGVRLGLLVLGLLRSVATLGE